MRAWETGNAKEFGRCSKDLAVPVGLLREVWTGEPGYPVRLKVRPLAGAGLGLCGMAHLGKPASRGPNA